jgi:hypothetical protein
MHSSAGKKMIQNSHLSIAVANGPLSSAGYAVLTAEASKNGLILPRARHKQNTLERVRLLDTEIELTRCTGYKWLSGVGALA